MLLLRLLARLPDQALYFLSDILSWILRCVFRYRKDAVENNILIAFPDKTAEERAAIAKKFYGHIADVTVEILMLSRMSAEKLLSRVEIFGLDYLYQCKNNKQSMLLLSAHQGNWEWMLTAVASALPFPLDALYRPLHNPAMDRFFMNMRTRLGAGMIPADKAARVILKLRREVRAFGILADQNPRRRDEKYWTTFMGVDTPVVIGPERIAKLTGYPLFYVATYRVSRGRYRVVIEPLLSAPYTGEGLISQVYMDAAQAHIRSQPENWMWSHQRWRYQKKDCPRGQG